MILLKNGTLVDYKTNTFEMIDVLINAGKIVKIEHNIPIENLTNVIDCSDLYIFPGLVDIHCHLRQPGFEYKETIETGCNSAVKGGFTTICAMPNTNPAPDNASTLEWIVQEGKRVNLCNVYSYSTITIGELGNELVDFEKQVKSGAIAFSDDGLPLYNSMLMRDAIVMTSRLGKFVASHCEDKYFVGGGINEGKYADAVGIKGSPRESEELMVAREIVLSRIHNARVHICHISTKGTVEMIRSAKSNGVKVTCETCPHYFSLTEKEVLVSGTNAKINPALREQQDIDAIVAGLKDGTIDAVVTDHAPHSIEDKLKNMAEAPNGFISFETALPVTYTYLIDKGILSFLDMVRLMAYAPARLVGLDKGYIEVGKDADLTLFNPNIEYTLSSETIVSKSKNTPFIGKKLKGEVAYTIVNGRVVYSSKQNP